MRRDTPPDMSSLARLAQASDADLRPLLLRVQTQAFVSSPRRDASVRDYAAIALGLIPLVTDDVLADTYAVLRTVEDAPAAVMEALAARLGRTEPPAEAADDAAEELVRFASRPYLARSDMEYVVALGADDADLALARNTTLRIDGHALDALVERARARDELARALLARPEPGVLHRAALYGAAEPETRIAIRSELSEHLARSGSSAEIRDRDAPARILSLAAGCRPEVLWPFLAAELRLDRDRALGLDGESGPERLVLALRALDMPAEDCIALVLSLDWPVARSIAIVFELAALARSTGVAVASVLVGGEDTRVHRDSGQAHPAGSRDLDRHRRGASAFRRLDDSGTAFRAARTSRPAMPNVPSDRRSTATTGPGRT